MQRTKTQEPLEDRFKYQPPYRLAMSKRTRAKHESLPAHKEVEQDIPDQDHMEVFLARNIFS